MNSFKELKENFKKNQIPDWKNKLLRLSKEAMKIQADIQATQYMTSLHEFEKYIKSTHVSEIDVISDLLSEIVKKETPTTAIQSIPLIQDSLIILGTIRKRKLGGKFNEQHLETIITHSLTFADQTEYRERYAREKYEGKLFSSTFMGTSGGGAAAGGSDSDSDASIDWDKTMHVEII